MGLNYLTEWLGIQGGTFPLTLLLNIRSIIGLGVLDLGMLFKMAEPLLDFDPLLEVKKVGSPHVFWQGLTIPGIDILNGNDLRSFTEGSKRFFLKSDHFDRNFASRLTGELQNIGF